jgi:hypothetical protein
VCFLRIEAFLENFSFFHNVFFLVHERLPFQECRREVSVPRYVQIKPLLNGRVSCLRVYWRRGIPDRRNRWS